MIYKTKEQTKDVLYQKLDNLIAKDTPTDNDIKTIAILVSAIKDLEQIDFMAQSIDCIHALRYDIRELSQYLKQK